MSRLALRGRIVTMADGAQPIDDGVVYVADANIIAALPHDAPRPPGFEAVNIVDTAATIFPGLIELHNHLAYNVIGLWVVAKKYTNRDQWPNHPSYQTNLTGPMKVLASSEKHLPAITRYVECKALLGGTTATQGVTLSSSAGIRTFFKGLVLNVESTLDKSLPNAKARIGDVTSKDAEQFRDALTRTSAPKCYLLHLSEGRDDAAHKHFEALATVNPEAIAPSLCGIHCVALNAADYKMMAKHNSSMVWSPFSNMLLYGGTADVKAARAAGVRIGLGPDWAYSGSKNLLGELKVAQAMNAIDNLGFSDRDILEMATIGAARILHWDARTGSIEAGKRADLIAVGGVTADAIGTIFKADESDVKLVMIGGNARFGSTALMTKLGAEGESIKVGGVSRVVSLANDQPGAPAITLTDAAAMLAEAFKKMPQLAKAAAAPIAAAAAIDVFDAPPKWHIALDEIVPTGLEMRPHLPVNGRETGMVVAAAADAVEPAKLKPMRLDPLTFADDDQFIDTVSAEPNLGDALKEAIYAAYRRKPSAKAKGKKAKAQPSINP